MRSKVKLFWTWALMCPVSDIVPELDISYHLQNSRVGFKPMSGSNRRALLSPDRHLPTSRTIAVGPECPPWLLACHRVPAYPSNNPCISRMLSRESSSRSLDLMVRRSAPDARSKLRCLVTDFNMRRFTKSKLETVGLRCLPGSIARKPYKLQVL